MSSFIKPMLASPLPANFKPAAGQWAVEQKYDGHRLMVHVHATGAFDAWSRNGLTRALPPHIISGLQHLPAGLYDGELLVPGKRSYGVTELANGPDLVYYVFDVLKLLGRDVTLAPYDERRDYLQTIFTHKAVQSQTAIMLAPSWPVESLEQIHEMCRAVWDAEGEGLIVKRRKGIYVPGKRSKDFLKMKDLRSAVLTVIGFQAGKGTIVARGAYATVMLRDDDGIETTVKTLNDKELARLERDATEGVHPAIGRKLRIEYQEKTTDGNYRHPRWDRWEDE